MQRVNNRDQNLFGSTSEWMMRQAVFTSRPTCSPRRRSRGRLYCSDLVLGLAVLWSEKEKLNKVEIVNCERKYVIQEIICFIRNTGELKCMLCCPKTNSNLFGKLIQMTAWNIFVSNQQQSFLNAHWLFLSICTLDNLIRSQLFSKDKSKTK